MKFLEVRFHRLKLFFFPTIAASEYSLKLFLSILNTSNVCYYFKTTVLKTKHPYAHVARRPVSTRELALRDVAPAS